MEHHDLENLKTHILASDLLVAQGFQPPALTLEEEEWEPAFCPRTFARENKEISLEQFALD